MALGRERGLAWFDHQYSYLLINASEMLIVGERMCIETASRASSEQRGSKRGDSLLEVVVPAVPAYH